VKIEEYMWTFNMPTDHPRVSLHRRVRAGRRDVRRSKTAWRSRSFVHENRIRQAASSLGAAQYCINESVKYAASASRSASRWPQPGDPVAAGRAATEGDDAALLIARPRGKWTR
jgi:hypothetical protein